ncbi:hypothetical protein GGH16_005309, partial [Coemansia sp. RSA 560]
HRVVRRVDDDAPPRRACPARVLSRRGPLDQPGRQLGTVAHRSTGLDHKVDQHKRTVPHSL